MSVIKRARRVPAGWRHPTAKDGEYTPLLESGPPGTLIKEHIRFGEQSRLWQQGIHPDQIEWPREAAKCATYEAWAGMPARSTECMPEWPTEQRTHWQMYSEPEGVPLSPVFESAEELAAWFRVPCEEVVETAKTAPASRESTTSVRAVRVDHSDFTERRYWELWNLGDWSSAPTADGSSS